MRSCLIPPFSSSAARRDGGQQIGSKISENRCDLLPSLDAGNAFDLSNYEGSRVVHNR